MAIVSFTNYKRKQTCSMMRAVMRYTMQEKKTAWEDKRLVSGVNCLTETACGDFMTTKRLHHKEDGTLFYHMVQSFPAGETVDPVTAHAAALELANYFSDCEVLVCTHVDRDHIHSHFIINSVQLENGKKLHIAKEQLQELRQRNDEVCAQFGLPVFQKQETKKVKSVSNAEYHTALKGESWKLRLANTIDECMKYASDREEFISLMESEGYAVRWERGRKYITYTTPEGMKCRDSKLHEEKYLRGQWSMNSGFEQRKSLQELKQINQPNTEPPTSQTAPITPIVIQCPMVDTLPELTQRANDACWELQTIRETLSSLKSRIDLTAVQTSLTEMQSSLTQMISLLEQDGSRNERRTCKWLNWLLDFDLLVVIKWIVLVLVLTTAALAMVYGTAAVVSSIRSLFP